MWIVGLSRDPVVCQGLTFSYGVQPVQLVEDPTSWRDYAQVWLQEHEVSGPIALLVAGPSSRNPDANYRLEFLKLGEFATDGSVGELVSGRSSSRCTESEVLVR